MKAQELFDYLTTSQKTDKMDLAETKLELFLRFPAGTCLPLHLTEFACDPTDGIIQLGFEADKEYALSWEKRNYQFT